MKLAILTIQSMNYGNRLQNWALQNTLIALGHNVETIRRDAGIHGSLITKLKTMKRAVGHIKHLHDWIGSFHKFDRMISFSKAIVSKEFVSADLTTRYDAFIVGSDQVWNPDFDMNSELDYLPFIDRGRKVAYAASFGVSDICEDREKTAQLLRGFKSISVREDAGAEIVYKLTGQRIAVVLDPTMLVSVDEWSRLSTKPDVTGVDTPYLLKYVLGNDVHKMEIESIAQNQGLQVIDLGGNDLPVGPSEFLWLIEHAKVVCIDSFHGSVFSLLFHRPFVIFERQSANADMSSRFDTLCRVFDMGHHRFCSPEFDYERCLDEDWGAFERRLAAERERSLGWLSRALEEVGGRDA